MNKYFKRKTIGFVVSYKKSKNLDFLDLDNYDVCKANVYDAIIFPLNKWDHWVEEIDYWNKNGSDGNYSLIKIIKTEIINNEEGLL